MSILHKLVDGIDTEATIYFCGQCFAKMILVKKMHYAFTHNIHKIKN